MTHFALKIIKLINILIVIIKLIESIKRRKKKLGERKIKNTRLYMLHVIKKI